VNITKIIKAENAERLKKTAVIEGPRKISYQELFSDIDAAASELSSYGAEKGARVGLVCDDSIDYIVVSLAVLSICAVVVPVPLSLSTSEIEDALEKMDVNLVVFDRTAFSANRDCSIIFEGICQKKLGFYRRLAKDELPAEYINLKPAFIRFTSGTTGASKGVVISHQTIILRTDAADKILKVTTNDVAIWVLSMSFHFVVTILLFLRRGATIVICTGGLPDSIRKGLKQYKGTLLYASPLHYKMLVTSPVFSPGLLSSVRIAVSTAMHLTASDAQDFNARFGVELTQAYGIIEVGLPFINDSQDPEKRGSVGRVLPDYRVKIINPDAEGAGVVLIQGQGLFDAYFSPWQSSELVMEKGWFNTGDLGRIDSEGFLFLVGRDKNIINFAGMKIFPNEVESVLNLHPEIKESLVYGMQHPLYGEIPCADIILTNHTKNNFDQRQIRSFCYQHLARFKVPKEIKCVVQLDKTASGKLKRW